MKNVKISKGDVIKKICEKEENSGIYNIRIDKIPVYILIRSMLRNQYIRHIGFQHLELKFEKKRGSLIINTVISFYHMFKLLLFPSKSHNLFISFPRLDKIGTLFCDKFTDPYIMSSNVGNDFVIFEHSKGGKHLTPRMHSQSVYYIDAINAFARCLVIILYPFFRRKYNSEFQKLFCAIDEIFESHNFVNPAIAKLVLRYYFSVKIYRILYKRLEVKCVFSPARPVVAFIAAHLNNIKCYEMMHGVTYGETNLYSGYVEPMAKPDYFLAFGDVSPKNVYGINVEEILNVGWPLPQYMKSVGGIEKYNANDILVISSPQVSESILKAIEKLADENPHVNFYLRPHPHEIYDNEQQERINSRSNILIQDKTINIAIVLNAFVNIIGENSTALYEALSLGRKVGQLYYEGLNPIYLSIEDKECFWEIHNSEDLMQFINADVNDKKSKTIYSPFNAELFNSLIFHEA